ncbi:MULTISPECIES: hypothetical protein [Rhizobium]|uniref:Uncharacterized protein n=1 Tax=Rhizobium sophoriradicis TaxID=1535245 RepID=A0A2A5KY03_9HYPH|nr:MULTISPECIES: hypothetical protein [Rhizobium]ARQ59374.1 hypothetical protein Kim5_CH03349 [Rhizobium sp. Kim5]PCK81964.1 hypothetical protein CPT34_06285 [Rhizobium sophoriradicis]RSB92584.1 hypothetical protein EFR00_20565 [Rhizobium sophoriradicis]UWU33366.1 hypothetical protein N2597_14525 [Rhizobium leguminosarum bv. phaseoli]
MRKAPSFDSRYETAGGFAEKIAADGAYCAACIRAFDSDEKHSADEVFLEQNVRFQEHIADGAALDALLAELVFSLDRLTAEVSADLDSFRGLTMREKMAGWTSRQRMWRMYTERVREAPVIERLLDLLVKSDALARLITTQRSALVERHKAAEHNLVSVVEHRRRLVDSIDIARLRMKELNAKALTTQGRIGVYGNRAHWEQMEAERRALKAEAERISTEEHEMRDDSQRRERFISLFQAFVDAMNSQIAVCNVLLYKLMIDVEERLIIYQAQVDTDRPGMKARIKPEFFPDIAAPIRLFEKGMLVAQDLERRKGRAALEVARRLPAYAEPSPEAPGAPLIDTVRRPFRFSLPFLRS